MRLPSALASAALLLASTAAQTTTTTDVYNPPVLSAAGNVSGLPGGNEFCGSARVRKPWGALSSNEQALYLEATEMAVADGGVSDFAAIASDSLGQAQGEYSCGFFSWHRRLLLAYESYLRELDERFACLTIPYYDVHTAYVQAVNGECTNMFECSGIFAALGGAPNSTDEATLTFNGVKATGYAVSGAPYQEACDDEDNCGYVVRDDVSSKGVPSAASFGSFQSVVATSSDYASFLEGIQYGVHNEVLDAVGGAFATAAAARDVLYYSWYSALDMYLHVYHLCRIGVPLTYEEVIESLETYANATQTCGGVDGVDATTPLIMRINVNGELVDASEHPTLGQYFGYVGSDNWNYADIQQLGDYSYTYELPEMLRQQILSNNDVCPGFNRAFAASYSAVSSAAVKRTTTTKTTTKTTTTKTTKIVNGKKVTTTKVTKVVTKANSTTSSSAKSTSTKGQLVSSYGYAYLGNFSTDNVNYGEGTYVTNGYTGYTPYYSNGAITTKHNGILSANHSSSSSSASTTNVYSNTSNVVMNVKVGTSSVARNVTASVATSGAYWAWLKTAYDGLYTRFEGNLDLVATHMKLLECYTFESVYGLSNYTTTFVTDKNLITNRVECGQRLDLVRSGLLQLAVQSTEYSAKSLKFASTTVIRTLRTSYKRVTTRKTTYIRKSYTQRVQSTLKSTQNAMGNITVTSMNGSGDNETSIIVVDTGYVTSNSTSTTEQSAKNATAVTTTSNTTTTTTTAANVSETLSEASSGSMELEMSGSSSDTDEGSSFTVTGSNGETTTTMTTGSGGFVETTTTGSGGKVETYTTGSGATTTTVTTGSGASSTTTTTGSGGSIQIITTGSGGSIETATTGSGETTTTVTTGSGETTTSSGSEATWTGSDSTGSETGTLTPGVTPSATTPGATPAATKPNATPSATPASTKPSATPAATTPSATPAATTPSATPAATKPRTTPAATPAATTPAATPASTKPSATPAATTPSATPAATTPSATPATTTKHADTCIDVSVEGDATYCIEGPICSGSGDSPAGSLCPVKGDTAVQDCNTTLSSYTDASTCVAPQDAVCAIIKTGAWGCVFSTSDETPTPAPTKTESKTPAPTKTEDEKPTPAPTTTETTPAPTTPSSDTTPEVTPASTTALNEDDVSSSSKMFSTSYAATTTASDETATTGAGLGVAAVGTIVAAVCAVVALAGFTAYKMRQRTVGDLTPSGYYAQPVTPVSQSMKL